MHLYAFIFVFKFQKYDVILKKISQRPPFTVPDSTRHF